MLQIAKKLFQILGYDLNKIKKTHPRLLQPAYGPLLDHEKNVDIFQFSSSCGHSQKIKNDFLEKIKRKQYTLSQHSCPICQQTQFSNVAHSNEGFTWGICRSCGLLQCYNRLIDCDLNSFYESGEYQIICMENLDDDLHFQLEHKVNSLCFIDIFRKLDLALQNKRILEIGCGSGGILLSLHEHGAVVFGYDIDAYRIEKGRKYLPQLQVGNALDNNIELPENIDYVILSNILEHLPSVQYFLSSLREKLQTSSPGCKIIIDVPNLETAHAYSNEGFLRFLHIAHLWYFNTTTLERLLNQAGFVVSYAFSRDASISIIAELAPHTIQNLNNAYWNSISSINYANFANDPNNVRQQAKRELQKIF